MSSTATHSNTTLFFQHNHLSVIKWYCSKYTEQPTNTRDTTDLMALCFPTCSIYNITCCNFQVRLLTVFNNQYSIYIVAQPNTSFIE